MIDLTLSKRERIMRHLVNRFERLVEGTDGARITWDYVRRTPMTKAIQIAGNSLGIYDTSEKVSKELSYDVRLLNVVFEFHAKVNDAETDDVPTILNQVLGEVQRVALLDIQMGGSDPDNLLYKLAINTEEQGSEIDIGGEKPSVVTGVVIVRVTYRTKTNDPFSL